MNNIDISVIIVNYNTLELTRNCIESIRAFTHSINYEVILVDNGSVDGSKEFFQSDKAINYIYSEVNLGFGMANNLGVSYAKGTYLLFLNSDTLLFENSIYMMHRFFTMKEQSLKIGALGCSLVDLSKQKVISGASLPTYKSELRRMLKTVLHAFANQSKKTPLYKSSSSSDFFEIGYVIGADLMIKKDIFQQLSGFSSDFFMYYEETDLQFRLKSELFLKCYIYTGTNIIHLEGASSGKGLVRNNWKRTVFHESRNRYFRRNHPEMFLFYSLIDCVYTFLNSYNKKYSKSENISYRNSIMKTYTLK